MQMTAIEHLLLYGLAFAAMMTMWRFWPAHWKIRHVLVISVLLRAAMMPFAASDDVNRYVWEGVIQNHGCNPYSVSPDDPSLIPLRNDLWQGINHKDMKAIYGPFSELLFRACALVSRSPLFFKIVFTLFDLGTLVFLLLLMRTWSMEIRHVVLYALNPLVLFSFAGEGHLEIILVFWLVAGLYFLRKNKHVPAFICFGFCLATKITPVFLLPLLITRKNASKSLFTIVPLLLYLVYYSGAAGAFLSVPFHFASTFHFNGFVNKFLLLFFAEQQASTVSWALCAAILGLIFFFVPNTFRSVYYAAVAFCMCSTTLHPWYAAMLTPFLALYRSPAFMLLHLTLGLAFLVRINYIQTGIWQESWIIWIVEYVPFAAIGLWCWLRNVQNDPATFPPPNKLSVIIPVFNEQDNVLECIKSIPNDPDISQEIIVADGGSTDATIERIKSVSQVKLAQSGQGRGTQIGKALQQSTGDTILVLHADCRPDPDIISRLVHSLKKNPSASGGSFHSCYESALRRFSINTFLNNLRTRVTGISFGDQAQFFRKTVLGSRFPRFKVMEDIELSYLIKESGAMLFLPCSIHNATRTWDKRGYFRNFALVFRMSIWFVVKRRFGLLSEDCDEFFRAYYPKDKARTLP
jgi:hypothetical protein